MRPLEVALKIYLQTGVVLFLSWLILAFVSKHSFFVRKVSPRLLTRVAQTIFACALVLPSAFHLMPEQKIAVTAFQIFSPREGLLSKRTSNAPAVQRSHPVARSADSAERQSGFELLRNFLVSAFFKIIRLQTLPILIGSVLLTGWAVSFIKLAREFRELQKLTGRAHVIRQIGQIVILASDEIVVPFSSRLSGFAYVVVPTEMAANAQEFKLAIAHELIHHRRRDTQWAKAIEFAVALFFWNPGVYLWKRNIIELQEFACDETLLGQRRVSSRNYGNCLIKVAEAALVHRQVQTGTVCMAVMSKNKNRHKSFLRRRIDMFASYESSKRTKALGLALGTMSLLLTAGGAFGAQQAVKYAEKVSRSSQPNSGELNLQSDVQAATQAILEKYVRKFNAKAGFVLVTEAQTGRVLAVANVTDDPKAPKFWSLSYQLEPASIMKVPLIASALEAGVTTPDETHDCGHGVLKIGNGTYRDWKPFGSLTTSDTAVHSSNICSIRIAQKLGADGVAKSLIDFGFGPGGTTTGFPQAKAGEVPDPSLYNPDDYLAVIAMGTSASLPLHASALEVVQAFAAIGNGGKLLKPLSANAPDSAIEVRRQVLSQRTANEMKSLLRRVVSDGTGQPARSKLYTTAGKTSSAYSPESADHDSTGGERSMGGFAGFAPATNPRLAVYVGMLDPREGKDHNPHGSRHAAPVFKEVIETLLPKLGVEPDQQK
jgi:beta-lactamase regulating signal transducer with metallopeptidase domain